MENRKVSGSKNWARSGGTVARSASNRPCHARVQLEYGSRCCAMFPPYRQIVGHPTLTCGTVLAPLSLLRFQKETLARDFSSTISFPFIKVRTTCHSPLASHWLALPFLISFRVAYPHFLAILLPKVSKLPSCTSNAHGLLVQLEDWAQEFLSKLGVICPLWCPWELRDWAPVRTPFQPSLLSFRCRSI
jgi:hypothetical protein